MEYTLEIDIHQPLKKVVELFNRSSNIKKWQPELLSFELLSGEEGAVGAESKLIYKMGNNEIEMTEVITINDLPEKFAGVYETDNVWNLVENSFVAIDDSNTRWICKNEFKCTGFVKLMALIMPGMFQKQSSKHLEQFKKFAESQ